jgi:FkbM family methyltransferase
MNAFSSNQTFLMALDQWYQAHLLPLADKEHAIFDDWLTEFSGPLIIYGAGGLGQKLARGLQLEGIRVDAFCDGNPALHQTVLHGIPVESPTDAVSRAGKTGGFLIATWSLGREVWNSEIQTTLRQLGAEKTLFFTAPFWKYPERFLPHYRIDLPSRMVESFSMIRQAAALMEDEESRHEFLTQLKMLATTTFDEISYRTDGDTYFPADLVVPDAAEAFVDCGAYDGDTLQSLLRVAGGTIAHYWGFEPDAANLTVLTTNVRALHEAGSIGTAEVYPFAVSNENGTVSFSATGGVDAKITPLGDTVVECRRLDDLLGAAVPTFIKMDIEGAELSAIDGCADVIRAHEPTCAVCIYHLQAHLWSIPLRLKALVPDHKFHLRAHAATADIVCYAVPRQCSQRA